MLETLFVKRLAELTGVTSNRL